MKKFKEFFCTHGIVSLILGGSTFLVNLMIRSEIDPMLENFTIWDLVAFICGTGSYYIIWWFSRLNVKKKKERAIAFLEEYLPLSGKRLFEGKSLIRYSWHWSTKPYKIGKIASFLYDDDRVTEDRNFTFYFNTTENGSLELYPFSRKIKASDSMKRVLKKIPAKEVFGKLDSEILNFFEMGDLYDLAKTEDIERTIQLNTKKAMELLGN